MPVLEGILLPEYLDHLCYLVVASHLLLGDCISPQDLTFAHECLLKFYSESEELYSKLKIMIYPVFMQLLGYAHGITVIIPSDISPDMFGTRSCR